MAKQTVVSPAEALKAAFGEFIDRLTAATGAAPEVEEETPAKGSKGKKAAKEVEAATADDDEADLPEVEDIDDMDKADVAKFCGSLGIEVKGYKLAEQKALLTTAVRILREDTDDLEESDAESLCEAVAVAPAKKLEKTIAALSEYLTAAASGGEEAEAAAATDDDDNDGVDRETIAEEADLPDTSDMVEQLEAYNEAAEDDDKIEFNAKKPAAGYRELIKLMIDGDGNVAEWGTAYIRNGEACCCGLPLAEHVVKGEDDAQFGKCVVSGTVFKAEEDGSLSEYTEKKPAKKGIILGKKK